MNKEEIIEKYNINLESLKQEQLKLAKNLSIKDALEIEGINLMGAVETIIIKNNIIAAVIICDKNFNVLEQQYSFEKLKFPYISGFRDYRELNAILNAFNKLQEKPDLVLLRGEGIMHPRLGFASHFSLAVGIPAIGVCESLLENNILENEDIKSEEKIVGKILKSKENSNPIYISPGNKISVLTSLYLIKKLIKEPHKLPEPLHIAHKYAKEIQKEMNIS